MTKSALREFYETPNAFHPFRLHLTSGKTVDIGHRENLLFTNDPDTIVVVSVSQDHAFSIIAISEIAEIIALPKPGPKGTEKS